MLKTSSIIRIQQYSGCQHSMSKAQLPLALQQYGFQSASTGYSTIDLIPNAPKYSSEMAHNKFVTLQLNHLKSS